MTRKFDIKGSLIKISLLCLLQNDILKPILLSEVSSTNILPFVFINTRSIPRILIGV